MSQKVGQINDYYHNIGDSPANISLLSEGAVSPFPAGQAQNSNQISTINSSLRKTPQPHFVPQKIPTTSLTLAATAPTPAPIFQVVSSANVESDGNSHQFPINFTDAEFHPLTPHNLNESRNNNFEQQQPSNCYQVPVVQSSLSALMKGKSPKEFAQMQVYGQMSSGKKVGKTFPNKSVSSINSPGTLNLQIDEGSRAYQQHQSQQGNPNQSVEKYESQQELAPSKYTICSQVLMKELQENGKINRLDERIQSQMDKKMLLSEDNIHYLEKENKMKGEHNQDQIKTEKELLDRIYYDQSSAAEKEQIKHYYLEKEMAECTFSPRLFRSHYQSVGGGQDSGFLSKREPNFFEQSQKMQSVYDHHRDVLRDAKENDEKQIVQEKPKLSKKSKIIGEVALEKKGLKDVNVVDRLYHEKRSIDLPKDQNPYRPQISYLPSSKPRQQRVDEFLYQDAKRRKQEESQQQNSKECLQSTVPSSTQKKNQQKALASKFDREFQNAVANMAYTKDPHLRSLPETMSYLESIEILQSLHFVGTQNHEDNQQLSLQVQRVWNQLSSNLERPTKLIRNLEVFLFAIQNIRADQSMVPFVTDDKNQNSNNINQKSYQLHPDNSSPRVFPHLDQISNNKYPNFVDAKNIIGAFDQNDNLYYTPEQIAIIHKMFKDIYDNRLVGDKKSNFNRTSRTVEQEPSFTPAISQTSRRLALEKRERVINDLKSNEGFDGCPLDINEILIYQQQLTRYKNEELKQKLEDEKMNVCSFHPKTKDFSKVEKYFSPRFQANNFEEEMQGRVPPERKGVTSTKSLGVHRTVELYSLAKPQNQRRDRDKGDIEYEKECDECTFAPDISHIRLEKFNPSMSSHLHSLSNPSKSKLLPQHQKGTQKSIDRIKSARVNKKVSEQLGNVGTTFSQKKRENQEKVVKVSLSNEKHIHHRPHGRFLSNSPHSHNSSNNNPRKVIQQSPQHDLHPHSDINDYHRSSEDFSKNPKPVLDPTDTVEYFLKSPNPVVENEKPPQQAATSKTMEEDRVPLLFVDVNIEDGKTARIIVYEGEKSEDLANKFAQEHNLDTIMTGRLKDLLDQQINSLLTKIDEEVGSDHDDEEGDSGEDEQGNFHHRRNKKKRISENNPVHVSNQDQDESHGRYSEDNQEYSHVQTPQDIIPTPIVGAPSIGMRGEEDNSQAYPIPQQIPPQVIKKEDSQKEEHPQEDLTHKSNLDPTEIQNMHMRALAATFKSYAESEEKRKQLPPSDGMKDSFTYVIPQISSHQNLYQTSESNGSSNLNVISSNLTSNFPATTYNNSNPYHPSSYGLNNEQSTTTTYSVRPTYQEQIENSNNQASNNITSGAGSYGIGFQNTFENRQSGQNSNNLDGKYQQYTPTAANQSSVSYSSTFANQYQPQNYGVTEALPPPPRSQKEIEEMHMRALATTYKNYSENENKFFQ